MRTVSFVTTVSLLLGLLACTPKTQADPEAVKSELLQLERRLIVAIQRKDVETLDDIWDDDYLATAPDGTIATKADLMSAVQSGTLEVMSIEPEGLKVRVFDNVAIMTGKAKVLGILAGKNTDTNVRGTGIFVKRPSGWRIAGVHVGPDLTDEPVKTQQ